MSEREIQNVRDANLARRVKLAIGGIPGLRLVIVGERESAIDGIVVRGSARDVRRLAALKKEQAARVASECARIFGEVV